MLYGGMDILCSTFGIIPDSAVLRRDEFWAVEDINFELRRGESFGIIGANGSGKTTLLKMLNGIFMPDKGTVAVEGKVGGLIQVGAGFHPMLSGRENIYVNGAILGLSKRDIDKNFDSIVDFADIGDFLDSPVKFYSSGMYVRLGFAIAVHSKPDILLIDEVLAVGDIKFQSKCLKFITNNILKNGCSIVFVSHNRYAVQDVCQKAIYLQKGRMAMIGKTEDVIGRYLRDIKDDGIKPENGPSGNFGVEGITKVVFSGKDGCQRGSFRSGEELSIKFHYAFKDPVKNPSIGISFIHDDPRYSVVSSLDYLFNLHSGYDAFEVPDLQGEGHFTVTIDHLYIPIGVYKCFVYLYLDNKMNLVHKYENAGKIEVLWSDDRPKRSLIELPHRWTRTQEAAL